MEFKLDALSAEKLSAEHIKAHSHAWSRIPLTGEEQVFRATVTATAFGRGELLKQGEAFVASDAVRCFTKYASTSAGARRAAIDAAFDWLREFT